ncbi:hypothetical protein [Larkinella terrae]|uniref:Uncharacterized protein n=1 Tax=Larkinella terrae TaxID=2025311 RepID=A0A7K0EIG1_9BACT|nr:hypothetical protein [Larkinella terrae]MRS61640.1 hypothetical protein [Larkinella terrae]
MSNLTAQRDSLIAELNQAITAQAGQPITGPLPAQILRLLSRIQKVNQQLNADTQASVARILDAQDALAEKVFGEGQTGPELVAEINRVSESIEDFGQQLSLGAYYYAAA